MYSNLEVSIVFNKLSFETREYLKSELKRSRFTLPILQQYLDSSNTCVELSINNSSIQINVVCPRKEVPPILLLKRVIKRLYTIWNSYKLSTPMIIWLIPYNCIRSFPDETEIIGPNHINGGYTLLNKNEIFIYRFEDFPKVMLHELLHHCMNYEFTQEQVRQLKIFFNISSDTLILPNEAIVEAWATYYQLRFISREYDIPFKELYKKECQWGLMQSRRLLAHQIKLKLWREKTNAYCYIIFKTILLLNFDTIKNKGSQEIIDFIIKYAQDNQYLQAIANTSLLLQDVSMRISLFGDM